MSLSRARYQGKNWGRNQNITRFSSEKRGIGPVSNTVILIVLACLLGLFYLAQVTKTNAYGYEINELTQEQTRLQAEHDQLQVSSARLQSLDRARTSAAAKKLVSTAPTSAITN